MSARLPCFKARPQPPQPTEASVRCVLNPHQANPNALILNLAKMSCAVKKHHQTFGSTWQCLWRRTFFTSHHDCYLAVWIITLLLASLPYTLASGGDPDLGFIVEPQDTIVTKDAPALLDCAALGSPTPTIEWKRDGLLLSFIGDPRRSILSNGSLYFSSVVHTRNERPDEGIYQCVASSPSVGSIVSRTAKLQVAVLPKFVKEPVDVSVSLGDTARLTCQVTATPSPRVYWLKEDQAFEPDPSRMHVLPSGTLEIDSVVPSDAGRYRCNATSLDKHALSTSATLRVLPKAQEAGETEPPTFIALPKNLVVMEGDTITLDCAANGNPRPWITWLKDGNTIDVNDLDSRFVKVGTGNLQISQVHESDAGMYQCRAENSEDSVDVTANLEVHVAPRFVKKPQNVAALEKEDAELECDVYGRPEPTIQWMKNGDPIIASEYFQIVNGHNLRILGLVASDAGIYQCMGSNTAGNVQAAAQLRMLQPESSSPSPLPQVTTPADIGERAANKDVPSAPRELDAAIILARFVTLKWKEPIKTNGNIFTYSVYYKQDGSERERVVNTSRSRLEEVSVQGLLPDKKYYMRVVAINQHGPGESSPVLEIHTQSEANMLGPPVNLTLVATSPTSILATWQPPQQNTGLPIVQYKLFYMESGSGEEHEIVTSETWHSIHNLKKFTEYGVWVVAFTEQGPGSSTDDLTVRTLSDLPSMIPQNVAAEAASSTSIIVRWEPPPKEHQNGVITGYKIRYKPKGRGRGSASANLAGLTATTDGSRRLHSLTGLTQETEYQIKVSAMTVNGSGPATDWITAETFENDLDEGLVPEPPSSLRARPSTNAITVSWTPPSNQNIMVRGYTIGWGKGIPDAYTKLVDGKQRSFSIDSLEANSEYVISLRAYNQMGDGRPIYETVRTREEATPEPLTPLIPPVGLKAIVLSASTVVLYWTDTTLPRNQLVTDSRYYTVRYTSTHTSLSPRYRYLNATDLNCMLDDLKPNTQYEFTVKVIKNRRESPWSLVVLNTTEEFMPTSAPRDLTVVAMDDNPTVVNLNWQPPKQPNGQITGYVIFYTTDQTQRDRDWVVEGVVGDKMTTTLKGLTPETTYFFKIQARNKKGYGPLSNTVSFKTGPSNGMVVSDLSTGARDGRVFSNTTLFIILGVAAAIIVILGAVLAFVFCRRCPSSANQTPDRSKKGYVKGNVKGKLAKADNPPDLWIHHDQMEMKGIEKGQRSGSSSNVSPMPRHSQDMDTLDSSRPLNPTDSLDRRGYVTAYAGGSQPNPNGRNSLRRPVKPKSLLMAAVNQPQLQPVATATALPNGSLATAPDVRDPQGPRPMYPKTQYHTARAHVTVDSSGQPSESAYSTQSSSYDSRSSLISSVPTLPPIAVHVGGAAGGVGGSNALPPPAQQSPAYSTSSGDTSASAIAMAKRPHGHPLKSFTVPAPPPQSTAPKHMVSPLASRAAASASVNSSPYKKAVVPPPMSPTPPTQNQTASRTARPTMEVVKERLQPSYSTEELTQEMANLEGLMRDLNAITASDFN